MEKIYNFILLTINNYDIINKEIIISLFIKKRRWQNGNCSFRTGIYFSKRA